MKQAIVTTITAGLLGATLALAGCAQSETAKPATTATPVPTAEVVQRGDLQKAAEQLEKALGELQNKNYRGALDWINGAHKEVTATLNNLNAPAALKTSLELANAGLDKVKTLVEQRDPAAEKSLTAAITQITKLAERLQSLNNMAEAAKGAAGTVRNAAEKALPKKQ